LEAVSPLETLYSGTPEPTIVLPLVYSLPSGLGLFRGVADIRVLFPWTIPREYGLFPWILVGAVRTLAGRSGVNPIADKFSLATTG